eukprot:scaffold479881_cov18-Prasinocladus_malaysianus.AAC.2
MAPYFVFGSQVEASKASGQQWSVHSPYPLMNGETDAVLKQDPVFAVYEVSLCQAYTSCRRLFTMHALLCSNDVIDKAWSCVSDCLRPPVNTRDVKLLPCHVRVAFAIGCCKA